MSLTYNIIYYNYNFSFTVFTWNKFIFFCNYTFIIAFSLERRGWEHLDAAAAVARQVVEHAIRKPLPARCLLNVNIPNRPLENMRGLRVTRLGRRHPSEPVARSVSPFGDEIFWIGPVGQVADNAPGTDFHAVAEGAVSITPLRIDLTDHEQVPPIHAWLDGAG